MRTVDLRMIDSLVANRVMGLPSVREVDDAYAWAYGGGYPVPDYSTDIAAAWGVVENFDGEVTLYGPSASYAGGEYRNRPAAWRCEIDPDGEGLLTPTFADTAPLAICLAALKAKGVDVDAG